VARPAKLRASGESLGKVARLMRTLLYHIATAAEWSLGDDTYAPQSFEVDGFIHCSTGDQLLGVANARFRGRTDLVLLHIDADFVRDSVRYENLEGGAELYPHLYRRLERAHVTEAAPLFPSADGTFKIVVQQLW
jgi:uncharacterized protein (DUF952 family)